MLSKRFPILTIFIDHANVVIEIIAVKAVKYISFIPRPEKICEFKESLKKNQNNKKSSKKNLNIKLNIKNKKKENQIKKKSNFA